MTPLMASTVSARVPASAMPFSRPSTKASTTGTARDSMSTLATVISMTGFLQKDSSYTQVSVPF